LSDSAGFGSQGGENTNLRNHRIAFLALSGLMEELKRSATTECITARSNTAASLICISIDRLRKAGIEPAFCLIAG
jgi:hypothetical protein